MTKTFYSIIFSAVVIILSASCNQTTKKEYNADRFHSMLDGYWRGLLNLQPLDAMHFGDSSRNDQFRNTCTQAYRDEVRKFYLGYLDSLKKFSNDSMTEDDMLSFQVIKFDVDLQLENAKYDSWKIPFTQMGDATNKLSGNIVLAMGQYGSGESAQPFKTVTDYNNWLKRIHAYTIWCDSAIESFRQGIATNYMLPKTLVVKMINICDGLVSKDPTKSIFYGPIKNLPTGFSDTDKKTITTAYEAAIQNELNPAHSKLSAFLKNEYLPKARAT